MTCDGYVYVWGNNHLGQLGQGNTSVCTYATKMKGIGNEEYLKDIIDVSAGHQIYLQLMPMVN